MILIELIFDAPPDAHDNVAELARRTTAATHRENGCILYRFAIDLERQVSDQALARSVFSVPFRALSAQRWSMPSERCAGTV